jgi:hypothetical protein
VYRIIHVDQDWIVCEGQNGIIKFDRKAAALQAVHDAKELLHSNEPVESKQSSHSNPLGLLKA